MKKIFYWVIKLLSFTTALCVVSLYAIKFNVFVGAVLFIVGMGYLIGKFSDF